MSSPPVQEEEPTLDMREEQAQAPSSILGAEQEQQEGNGHAHDEAEDDPNLPPYKRAKRDPNVDPLHPDQSVVIHVRNLSYNATEADLLEALTHFGTIAYATCMPNKRMALVEFEDLKGAQSCVSYAQQNEIYVAGQPALFNYSTSKYIQRLGLESERPNHVLLIQISNVQYPINVDVIYKIAKPYGEVKRIAMIKRQTLQALVEYDSVDTARTAKHSMNGADIYSGCCTIKVEFAKPDTVKVTRNDQDQWDFTVPPESMVAPEVKDQIAGRKTLLAQGGGGGGGAGEYKPQFPNPMGGNLNVPMGGNMGYNNGPRPNVPYGGPPQQAYGGVSQYGAGTTARDRAAAGGGHAPYHGGGGGQYAQNDYHVSGQGAAGGGSESSQVVMVYGIEHNTISCDKLFNLLCLYGNVQRVKFMKSKLDTAMVQMATAQEVQSVIDCLHGAQLYGQPLAFRLSKQSVLHATREPFNLPDGTESYKDYIGNRHQRFNTAESSRRNRLIRPTAVLHWYNAPPDVTEQTITQLFADAGAARTPHKVVIFQGKSERSCSGLAEFETAEQATESLLVANHSPIQSERSPNPYIVKMAFATTKDNRQGGGQDEDY